MAFLEQQQILQSLLRYRTVLVRSGLLITQDYHAAEDIYQNLVVKSLNAGLEFENTSGLLAWCRMVLRSEGVDWLKKHGRELALDDSRLLDLLDAEIMDELKESREILAWTDMLDDCLKKLNSESQRILKLRYGGERSCGEVARMMEISIESVYKRLSRIHLKLRDCVNSKANGGTLSGNFSNES